MPKICTCCRVSEAKFHLYHSTKIAKAGPGFEDWSRKILVVLALFKWLPSLLSCHVELGISTFGWN